jgi:hypothetical protein
VSPARLGLIVVAFCALAGCAAAPSSPEQSALIAPALRFAIPAPRDLGYPIDASQLVTAHFRGETQVFEAHLTVSAERVVFIGLDPLGRRALTVTTTNQGMTIDKAPWLPAGLRPENIIADVAIMYWPEAAVRRGLARSEATLEDGPNMRSITDHGREVIHIDYGPRPTGAPWARSVRYRNLAFDYELDLQSAVTE